MSESKSVSQQSQVSDEDLIKAVRQQCELHGTPVVPTSKVSEVQYITVTKQTVKRRLDDIDSVNSIKVGRGKVWWVPDTEDEARGNIDMSDVYLEKIDPEDIPSELVRKHPEGQPTGWTAWIDMAKKTYFLSAIIFLAGGLLYFGHGYIPFEMTNLRDFGLLGVVGGFFVIAVSISVSLLAGACKTLGLPAPRLSDRIPEFRDWLALKLSWLADKLSS